MCDETEQPQGEGRQGRDQEQDLEALWLRRARVAQRKAPAMALQVAKSFFDLHPACVGALHKVPGAAVVRQRRRQEPGRAMQPAIGGVRVQTIGDQVRM